MPVNVEGLNETRRALKNFAPDLYKEMNKEITVAMKSIVGDAKKETVDSISGLSNWTKPRKNPDSTKRGFPIFNSSLIRRGLTYSTGGSKTSSNGFKAFYQLLNKSAAGAIMETAGSVSGNRSSSRSRSNNPNAGAHFNQALTYAVGTIKDAGGRKGRLLVAAFDRDQGKTIDAVFKSIDKATKNYNLRTKTIGTKA